jgi:Alpha/beta hydrolase domain
MNDRLTHLVMRRGMCGVIAALGLMASPALVFADVTKFEVQSTRDVSGGRSFGSSGPYEVVTGRLHFEVDPALPANRSVVDIDQARKNGSGRIEFSADVVIYRPRDQAKGNGIALIDVVNRGNKTIIGSFNRPGMSTDRDAGDGFVFSRGFTVVCVGWEFDVPKREGAIRLEAPVAEGIRGAAKAAFVPASRTREFTVADLAVYVPTDPSSAANVLTIRDAPLSPSRVIPRSEWRLTGNTVTLDSGFEPGRWYDLAYGAQDPPVGGVGFLAVRDTASWLKHASDQRPSKHVIGFGASQSGRFLRSFLYEGFNTDEKGRPALDGVMAHIAGAARIDLNRRWSTPVTQATYTATSFPFSDASQRDPVTSQTEGALDNPHARANQPKIFYTNTGVEYWGGGRVAALVHTSPDGARDLPLPANERVYFLTGSQHGPSGFPPSASNGQQKDNPTDYWWIMRGLLVAMEDWVDDGTTPPESRYPRFADGTLVAATRIEFPHVRDVASPASLTAGGRAANARVARDGAPGTPLPLLVPQVDTDGNERAGIRLPDVAVPLATLTGWNFRKADIGAPDQLFPLLGSYIPFAATKAQATASGDPRRSIEERYQGRESYLQQVRDAAKALVKDRYLRADDVDAIMRRAQDQWNLVVGQGTNTNASPAPR